MNLKTSVSRKQSTPNFPKKDHFLLPDTHTYEIRPFALLRTCYETLAKIITQCDRQLNKFPQALLRWTNILDKKQANFHGPTVT